MEKNAPEKIVNGQTAVNASEQQGKSTQLKAKKSTGKIAVIVLAAVLLIGGAVGVGAFVKQRQENAGIAEEERTVQIAAPLTEADRELDEIFDFVWVVDGFEVDRYTGDGGDVVIPEAYNGKPVLRIGDEAFNEIDKMFTGRITSITIPNSVTSMGNRAFISCTGLTSVTIPDSMTIIGSDAFYGCTGLTSVTIPDSVTVIGSGAFYGCTDLSSITIPDSVTGIGDEVFYCCTGLTSITIPDSVTSIDAGAFSFCTSLTSVTIPDSVTSIGDSAFSGCTNLTSITIPDSVTGIGNNAFDGCTKLTHINVDSRNPVYNSDDGVLLSKDGTILVAFPLGKSGEYTIPDSVTGIGDSAFYGCSDLSSISIPDSVTSIGKYAFWFCDITVTAPHEADYYGYTPADDETWVVQ